MYAVKACTLENKPFKEVFKILYFSGRTFLIIWLLSVVKSTETQCGVKIFIMSSKDVV